MTDTGTGQFSARRVIDPYLLGATACILVASIRIVGLGSYPALRSDEGFWVSGARNGAMFGDPLMDGRLHPFLSPASYLTLRGLFAFIPPNLMSGRVFSVVTGLLSCALMWKVGYLSFRRRPWIPALLFGLSGLAIVTSRMMLLESYQMLWMIVAAVLWLSHRRYSSLFSGAAMGMALLVKSSSIYLIPSFVISAIWANRQARDRASGLAKAHSKTNRQLWVFLASCAIVGTAGYLAAWSFGPASFSAAFRFELDGQHFDQSGALFHLGRFGLSPHVILQSLIDAFQFEPIIIPLSVAALIFVVWQFRAATEADWFFTFWLLLGAIFHFSQIHIASHYLATLTPAGAYLVARLLDTMLDRNTTVSPSRWMPRVAIAILFIACTCQLARPIYGIYGHRETDYWQTVQWIKGNISPDAKVMAAPYVNASLPQRSYDFYRLIFPYDRFSSPRTLESVVNRYNISFIVIDPEWQEPIIPDAAGFFANRCVVVASNNRFTVYSVREPLAKREPVYAPAYIHLRGSAVPSQPRLAQSVP